MRRIVSVFSSSSRRDKNDDKKPTKRIVSVSVVDDNAQAQSSSSSSGSASIILKTPDDVPLTPSSIRSKKWISWLSRKPTDVVVLDPPSQWQPAPPPLLRPAPLGRLRDESIYGESDDEVALTTVKMPPVTSETLSKSAQFIQVHTNNTLINQPSPPPFLIQHRSPLYPRSCNASRLLLRPVTLISSLHKRRLLQRLDKCTSAGSFSTSEAESIILCSLKPLPMPLSPPQPSSSQEEEKALSKTGRVSPFSPGLRRWISRPTFEDRFSVWTADLDGDITCQRITVTDYALAALEFSEAIESLADGDISPSLTIQSPKPKTDPIPDGLTSSPIPPSPPSSDVSSSPSSSSSNLSVPHSRTAPHLSAPSPLRNEHNPTAVPMVTASPAVKSTSPPAQDGGSVEPASNTKRGVRFAENDTEENVPIGYVQRVKKQREEKARFLREEKEKRIFEEERARVEEERQQREIERNEWEKERIAWEKEKRAAEEERKKRLYAEEFAASRQRAESSRMGMKISSSSVSLRDPPERNVTSVAPKRYSRPVYDSSRRQASEPAGVSSSPNSSSPENSRPPSIAPSSVPPPRTNSRPPSVYSSRTLSSTEDFRHSQVRNNYAGSTSSSRHGMDRSSTYSAQSNPNFMIPSIPHFPPFSMDMPLLPPTAPFMMNQYPRSRSRNSSPSSSPASSRQRLHSNGSTEFVNSQPQPGNDSSPRSSTYGSSSSSSPHRHSYQSHHRRGSDDNSRRLSSYSQQDPKKRLPQSPSSPHLSSHSSTMPRGRPVYPVHVQQQQMPSPWTAMPSGNGIIPTTMPYPMPMLGGTTATANNTSSRHQPSRRQTALS